MDPFYFYTDPDPQIRFVEKRIRVRPKIEKNSIFFTTIFLLITQKLLLRYFKKLLFQESQDFVMLNSNENVYFF